MSKNIKKTTIIILFLILSLLLFKQLLTINKSNGYLPIDDGVVDLTELNLSDDKVYQLEGEWQNSDNETYQIKIISSERKRLGIMLSDLYPVYRLWVNGKVVSSNGSMSESRRTFVPSYKHKILELEENLFCEKDGLYELELVLETITVENITPNFKRFILGKTKALQASNGIMIGLNLFAIGGYLTLILFSFSLYWGGKKENYLFYFALINFASLIKSLVNPHPNLLMQTINMGYFFMKRIDAATAILNTILLFILYCKVYPGLVSTRIYKTLIAVTMAVLLGVLTLKYSYAYWMAVLYFIIGFLIVALLCLYMNIRAILQNYKGAYLLLAGLLIYILSSIFTIFTALKIFPYGIINLYVNPAQYGSLIFVMLFSVVIAVKYAQRFAEADRLSSELKFINENLARIIEDKTKELKNFNKKLTNAYKRIIKIQRDKRMLLINVSHDLRTPITVIMGYVKSLREGMVEDDKTKDEFLERISIKTQYLNKLINDMFLLSRLEDNQVSFYKNGADINDFLRQIVDAMKLKMEEKGIKLIMKLDDTLDYLVEIDKLRMNQVVINILNNAIKYTEKGGIIEVGTERKKEGKVLIYIKDNGRGIADKDLAKIFKRYYKDKNRANDDESTGLGLCIAKEIVEKHHGKIWVESRLDEGAKFCILL